MRVSPREPVFPFPTDSMRFKSVLGGHIMDYKDCPQILREFLSYHDTIKGQSQMTISEYYLDLRLFLRFMWMVKHEMPYDTDLNEISIKTIDLDFIRSITTTDIYDYISFLANDRIKDPDAYSPEYGIGASARARKLSSIKSFYRKKEQT